MKLLTISGYAILAVVLCLTGCAASNQLTEPYGEEAPRHSGFSSHTLLGLYTFKVEPETCNLEIIPHRDLSLHLNALKFLEPPPFLNVTIEGEPLVADGILDVDIGIRHPFLAQHEYTAFDVCGIVFTHGSLSGFGNPDLVMATGGDTRLLNPDGYTRWWNPEEFPHGQDAFEYIDGLFGTPANDADFNCTLNGYKYFADGLGPKESLLNLDPSDRGKFSAGQKRTRHYKISLDSEFVFNYAIDCCWAIPTGDPPISAPDDFPSKANRPEAVTFYVQEIENDLYFDAGLNEAGGDLKMKIYIYDHFNVKMNDLYAESLAGLPSTSAPEPVESGEGYAAFEVSFTGEDLIQNGNGDLVITVKSEEMDYGGILPGEPVCAYFVYQFDIKDHKPLGWVRTIGGKSYYPDDMVVDETGYVYLCGNFREPVDFDNGPGVDWHEPVGTGDCYLLKYDLDGNFIWAVTWGGTISDIAYGVALDQDGSVFVGGEFGENCDFDPDLASVVELPLNGYKDLFLAKFSPEGDFLWARSWGGDGEEETVDIASDAYGNVCVAGWFNYTVDFDPGPGIEEYTYMGTYAAYVTKFDSDGNHLWARVWCADENTRGWVSVFDSSGNAYVCGTFWGLIDLDPGIGVDEYTADLIHPGNNSFIAKLDQNGNYIWGGIMEKATIMGADVDHNDMLFIAGTFVNWADLDPGAGTEIRMANGTRDAFCGKYGPSGEFQWANIWGGGVHPGGGAQEYCLSVNADNIGNVFVTGKFWADVDFDPGIGVDEHVSNGKYDSYLSRFNADGDFLWVRTWGNEDTNRANRVCSDSDLAAYVCGDFSLTVDFDPGPGIDLHTAEWFRDGYLLKIPAGGDW